VSEGHKGVRTLCWVSSWSEGLGEGPPCVCRARLGRCQVFSGFVLWLCMRRCRPPRSRGSDERWPRSGNPHHHARDVASVSGQQTPGSRWRGNPGLRMDAQRSDKPDGSSPRARPFRPRPAAEKGERRKWRGEFLGDVGGEAGAPSGVRRLPPFSHAARDSCRYQGPSSRTARRALALRSPPAIPPRGGSPRFVEQVPRHDRSVDFNPHTKAAKDSFRQPGRRELLSRGTSSTRRGKSAVTHSPTTTSTILEKLYKIAAIGIAMFTISALIITVYCLSVPF
jgi:hypothetical protein